MGYLKYYEEEQARWPELANTECAWRLVRPMVHRLAKEFHLSQVAVNWTRGNRRSSADEGCITLNSDNLMWLDVIHQLAHAWMEQRYQKKEGRRQHGKHHRKIVDRLAGTVMERKWHTGVLEDEVLEHQQTRQQQQQERDELAEKQKQEAEALRLQKIAEKKKNRPLIRMQKRRDEVDTLERQIRRLTKRLKKKRLSLKAYERRLAPETKAETPQPEAPKDDFAKPAQIG